MTQIIFIPYKRISYNIYKKKTKMLVKERKEELDKIVKMLLDMRIKANGDLNYVLYAFCRRYIFPLYKNYKNYCDELQ
jgi:hypothetical protein